MIFVPPRFAADSILEAEDAGIELIVAITEGIPAHDELRVYNHLARNDDVRLVGPNCPGILSPGKANVGHHPGRLLQRGQRRRRVAVGHADLPDRQRAGPARLRQLEHRRHRRRPGPGLELHRHHRPVPGRRRDRADRDGRRDRRLGRGGGRRVHRRATSPSRSSPTSRASPPRPARRWATRARSSPAPPAPRPPSRRRSRRAACASAGRRPRWRRSPRRSRARSSRVSYTSPLAEALAPDLLERFQRYVRVDTQSRADTGDEPEHARAARPRRGCSSTSCKAIGLERRRAGRQRLRLRDAARRRRAGDRAARARRHEPRTRRARASSRSSTAPTTAA